MVENFVRKANECMEMLEKSEDDNDILIEGLEMNVDIIGNEMAKISCI